MTRIVPQRLNGKRKWIECEPHLAHRFAVVEGIRIMQTYPTKEEAMKAVPSLVTEGDGA